MTTLRIVAPFAVDLMIRPGVDATHDRFFTEFWKRAQSEVVVPVLDGAEVTVEFPHALGNAGNERYASAMANADGRSDELLRVTVRPAGDRTPAAFALALASGGCDLEVVVAQVAFYDHGIAVLRADITVVDTHGFLGAAEEDVDALQRAISSVGAQLTSTLADEIVEPVLASVHELDGATDVLDEPMPTGGLLGEEVALGRALWVSRGLIVSAAAVSQDPGLERGVRAWLQASEAAGDAEAATAFVRGERSSVMEWMNYIHDGDRASLVEDEWRAMELAQWFYAALDVLDQRLGRVLGRSYAPESARHVAALGDRLDRLSSRARLVTISLGDLRRRLPRPVLRTMNGVLAGWDFDDLRSSVIEEKGAASRERIEHIESERSARAALYTDLILLGIGITSIVGTLVTLADFGRSSVSDPSFGGHDVSRGNVIQWLAAQPADGILMISAALSMLLIVVYLYLRRSQKP